MNCPLDFEGIKNSVTRVPTMMMMFLYIAYEITNFLKIICKTFVFINKFLLFYIQLVFAQTCHLIKQFYLFE